MIVVTDTSVVLNLCWLRQESLLSAIYEDVLAPGQVRLEFDRKAATDPRFTGLVRGGRSDVEIRYPMKP